MVRNAGSLLFAALLAAGCSNGTFAFHVPTRHYELAPGDHRIGVDVPIDWSVVNQGSEIRIRQGTIAQGVRVIEIRDLGPCGFDGVQTEVERARELWSVGRDLDARWRLRRIDVPPDWFATATQRRDFWGALDEVTGARRGADYSEVRDAFDALVDTVRSIEPPSLQLAVTTALMSIEDVKTRREVASPRQIVVDGHEAMTLETRYRLAHSDPRRYIVVRNGSRLLALWMDRSRAGADTPAFDTIVRSLRVRASTSPI